MAEFSFIRNIIKSPPEWIFTSTDSVRADIYYGSKGQRKPDEVSRQQEYVHWCGKVQNEGTYPRCRNAYLHPACIGVMHDLGLSVDDFLVDFSARTGKKAWCSNGMIYFDVPAEDHRLCYWFFIDFVLFKQEELEMFRDLASLKEDINRARESIQADLKLAQERD